MIILLYSYEKNGPGKVIQNLKKGFDLLSIPYKENSEINRDDFVISLQWTEKARSVRPENLLIGPNVCTLPIDNEFIMSQKYKKTLVPSQWVKDKYSRWLPEDKIVIWPVGIDTDLFQDYSKKEKNNDFLIYFKRRENYTLDFVCNFLEAKEKNFEILKYGEYSEWELIDKCKRSRYSIIIDGSESQGIATQEIMSCNLPMIVWDVKFWDDRGIEYKVPATSVPYWDDRCGERFFKAEELEEKFNSFFKTIDNYNPRDYILEKLNLKKQALEILNIFKEV